MKKTAATIVFSLIAVATFAAPPSKSANKTRPIAEKSAISAEQKTTASLLSGYKLVWSDEFDGKSLNTAEWNYRTDSKEWSTQKKENISLADGKLRVALKKEKAGNKEYTGGGVISKRKFKYGYYEARLKAPAGAGWHTSFWLMKADGYGGTEPNEATLELDICETDSVKLHLYAVCVHRWNPQPHKSFGVKEVRTPDLSANFHVWGCEVTPKCINYYFDGKLVQTVNVEQYLQGNMNIWLTVIASKLGGTKAVDDAKLPAAAEYDYVRFYEKIQ